MRWDIYSKGWRIFALWHAREDIPSKDERRPPPRPFGGPSLRPGSGTIGVRLGAPAESAACTDRLEDACAERRASPCHASVPSSTRKQRPACAPPTTEESV